MDAVTHIIEVRNACKILVLKPKRRETIGRHEYGWKDNSKVEE
jgi:hypothetical protein